MPVLDCLATCASGGIGQLLYKKIAESGDVRFEVGPEDTVECLWAHSLVVTTASPVLAAQLHGEFREAAEKRIRIPDVDPKYFRAFLELIYTGKLLCEQMHATVRVTGLSRAISQKAMVECFSVAVGEVVSGDILQNGEAHLTFRSAREANEAVRRFDRGLLNDTTIRVMIAESSEIDGLLEVLRLVDRYGVDGYGRLVSEELRKCIVWGRSLALAMVQCFSMPEDSEYQKAIWAACHGYATDMRKVYQLDSNFSGALQAFKDMEIQDCLQMSRAKLQMLRWALDLTIKNWDKLSELHTSISNELQVVVDELGCMPDAKRRRV